MIDILTPMLYSHVNFVDNSVIKHGQEVGHACNLLALKKTNMVGLMPTKVQYTKHVNSL